MSSGAYIGIANIKSNSQMNIIQLMSEIKAEENEFKISNETEIDFFVGPNKKILHKDFQGWIGKNKRNKLLNKTRNNLLKNAINQLYRPTSFIGDGGTASVIKFEKRTGIGLGRNGNTHLQKGKEMIKYIEKKILTQKNLTASDRKLANQLIKALKKAVWR